jgi:transposase
MRREEEWSDEDKGFAQALGEICPAAREAYLLVQEFIGMIRERQVDALDPWLARAARSGIEDLQHFATGLGRDYAAVRAALALSWSNCQVEGQVNRLKLIKRMMFGRANFDLLRVRVLHDA